MSHLPPSDSFDPRKSPGSPFRLTADHYRNIIEQSFDGVFVMTRDGTIVEWNEAMVRISGIGRQEAIGQKAWDVQFRLVPEELRTDRMSEKLAAGLQASFDNPDAMHAFSHRTVEMQRPDGRRCSAESMPFLVQGGSEPLLATILRDVTTTTAAARRLQRSETFLSTVFSSIQDGISVLDRDLTIQQVNPTMERWYGAHAPLVGKRCYHCYHNAKVPCEDCPSIRAMETGEAALSIVPGLAGSGVEWVELYAYPLVDADTGEVTGVVEFVRDITERRRMELQLRQAAKMEAIGQLAGGIAHDFNNQLAGVLGFADLLRLEVPEGSEAAALVDSIVSGARRASDLTQKLLAFSRQGAFRKFAVDMHAVIDEVVAIVSRTIDRKVTVVRDLQAPRTMVLGDLTQLQNAILNLALNARDAMPHGGTMHFATENVELDTASFPDDPLKPDPGEHLKISVTDTGIGMDAETQQRIFDPFFTTKVLGAGTGMGLAAVYGSVKAHHGTIHVDSTPGSGSTFTVYLPMAPEGSSEPTPEPKPVRPQVAVGSPHILLVDDDALVRRMAKGLLTQLGYRVTACGDGREAVAVYERQWQQIDAVLLDMIMPHLSGRETFERLLAVNPHCVALVSSGYSLDSEARAILDAGAKGFLPKPYRLSELAEQLSKVLSTSSPGSPEA